MTNFGNQASLFEDSKPEFHANGKKCRKPKEAWARWGLLLLVGATLLATAEAQTFQYSRGWTNGKRSGGYGVGGPYDLGTGEGMLGVDPLEVIIPPGHLQMSLNPQSRYRAGEYTQYLVKRSATLGNTKNKPMWIGTIVGMDTGVDGAGGSSITSPNAKPVVGESVTSANQRQRSGSAPSDF
ncbi:uncharacterized protein LOC110862025 [Folsomia candida]|uniref:Pro-corazonin n=1 Tax=Folsomia candida TaxID=158441 RepID=A0A226CXN8_FOLCA|nr:uncharacterized protein LOC110862025 [Folsomia candida]OXA38095.1 Pro-corazonin [Folsomia candida]